MYTHPQQHPPTRTLLKDREFKGNVAKPIEAIVRILLTKMVYVAVQNKNLGGYFMCENVTKC
jgi:hypothetical protein